MTLLWCSISAVNLLVRPEQRGREESREGEGAACDSEMAHWRAMRKK